MEGLSIQTSAENGVMTEQEWGKSRAQEEDNTSEASPLVGFTGEETDEDSEPEPPLVIRRKVSFADAFGLNLVSVKEFDNVEVNTASDGDENHPLEEFCMSCLFTVPSSVEELDERLQVQNVELESIELLPATTTLRGIIRVVNLCYSKSVYVRISLDRWQNYFDLLAEYVPGSSDRKTDRFSFRYALSPPFEREGTRVEFCLRYETSVGTFWANNKEMNYVLFCHHKGQMKELQIQDESPFHKGKRSCLRPSRRGSTEEKTMETINTAAVATETEATHKAKEADRKTVDITELHSLIRHEKHKPLVDVIRNRHRGARMACMKEKLFQRRQQELHDSTSGLRQRQKIHQQLFKPEPHPWGDSTSILRKHSKKQTGESPQVLTYHQIPLLTLDWNKPRGSDGVEDIWTGGATSTLSQVENMENAPSVNDIWETFLNGTDNNADEGVSVCDVWQAFLNGPSYEDHSGVPESEWLQTAASVSPSNDKITRHVARSRERISHVGKNTPEPSVENASTECQPLSHAYEPSLATVCDTCVSTPRDDSALTQHTPQRSQTNPITDTFNESRLLGPTYVSEGSVDSSSQWHKNVIWGRERGELTGRAGGIGGDEPFTPPTPDSVTSSGESETTDMTAVSQNASAVDRISQGARQREVTGTAHNAAGDTLAFRETIRQVSKDGEGFVFAALGQGAEEGITPNEESEASQRHADESQHKELRLYRNRKNPKMQSKRNESADEFKLSPTSEGKNRQSPIWVSKLKLDELENEDVASNTKSVFGKTGVELLCCATKEEARWSVAEVDNVQVLDEEAWQHNEKGLEGNSVIGQMGSPLVFSKECNKVSMPIPAEEEECILKGEREVESTPMQIAEKDQPKSQPPDNILNQTSQPKILEMSEVRWTHQKENEGGKTSMEKDSMALKCASTESEILKKRDEDENTMKQKTESVEELMSDVENPQDKSKNAAPDVKGQELSAVGSSPAIEGPKDPITAENAEVLGVGLDKMFAEHLVRGIWEEVLGWKIDAPVCNTVDGIAVIEGFNSDLHLRDVCLSEGQERRPRGNEHTSTGESQSYNKTEPDSNSNAHLSQIVSPVLSGKPCPGHIRDSQSPSLQKDQENSTRSVTCLEIARLSVQQSPSSEKSFETNGLISWGLLSVLSHFTSLLLCILLVAGFFINIFLYDFPAFFAIYVFSLGWWFCKWKRHRVTADKETVG